jgi:hypothetical protein
MAGASGSSRELQGELGVITLWVYKVCDTHAIF